MLAAGRSSSLRVWPQAPTCCWHQPRRAGLRRATERRLVGADGAGQIAAHLAHRPGPVSSKGRALLIWTEAHGRRVAMTAHGGQWRNNAPVVRQPVWLFERGSAGRRPGGFHRGRDYADHGVRPFAPRRTGSCTYGKPEACDEPCDLMSMSIPLQFMAPKVRHHSFGYSPANDQSSAWYRGWARSLM